MDRVGLIVGGSWIVGGLLYAIAAIPLLLGKVKRNRLYGARFPESLASDDAWFATNRYAARQMLAGALPIVLVGLAALFLPLESHPALAIAVALAPTLLLLWSAAQSWRFARRYRGSSEPRPTGRAS